MRRLLLFLALLFLTAPAHAEEPDGLATGALTALLAMARPERQRPATPAWAETPEAMRSRYEATARVIAEVSSSRWDVALLVGVAVHEGLAADIWAGQCAPIAGRCPRGAVSIWQLEAPNRVIRYLLEAYPVLAAGWALRAARRSWAACWRRGPAGRLASCASGTCDHGLDASAELVRYVDRALYHLR